MLYITYVYMLHITYVYMLYMPSASRAVTHAALVLLQSVTCVQVYFNL